MDERLPVVVVLDRVRSAYNVGAFFRNADGAGVAKLVLTGYTGYPPHPGISKTALGAEDQIEWEHSSDPLVSVRALRAAGYQLAAIETSAHAEDLYEWNPTFPLAVIFGNEVDGTSPELADECDSLVRIPMLGVKQSLNVAVAGGIVMYELLRKYRGRGNGGDSG